jgi:hypothetical protein
MAEAAKIPIIKAAVTAWRDTANAIGSMPAVFAVAVAAMLGVNAAQTLLLLAKDAYAGLGGHLLSLAIGIGQGFLLTPLAIAVHRFVLIGERTGSYALDPSNPRFWSFFTFSAVIQIVTAFPGLFITVVRPTDPSLETRLVFDIALLVFIAIVSVRTLIVFPAIAVDSPDADWRHAVRDTKGHSLRVFVIVIFTGLPFIVLLMPLYWLLLRPEEATFGSAVAGVVLRSTVSVTMVAALAALASRLYWALSVRLGPPSRIH